MSDANDYVWGCGCRVFGGNLIACAEHSPERCTCDSIDGPDPDCPLHKARVGDDLLLDWTKAREMFAAGGAIRDVKGWSWKSDYTRDYREEPCPHCNTMIVPHRFAGQWECGACQSRVPRPKGEAE